MQKDIETYSPSLASVLHMAEVSHIEGNTLTITVPYEFHKDKLTEQKTKQELEQKLLDIFGTTVHLTVIVKQPLEQQENKNNELHALATALGGELIG